MKKMKNVAKAQVQEEKEARENEERRESASNISRIIEGGGRRRIKATRSLHPGFRRWLFSEKMVFSTSPRLPQVLHMRTMKKSNPLSPRHILYTYSIGDPSSPPQCKPSSKQPTHPSTPFSSAQANSFEKKKRRRRRKTLFEQDGKKRRKLLWRSRRNNFMIGEK